MWSRKEQPIETHNDLTIEKPLASPWLILTAILFGTLFGTMGNSMASIALPSLVSDLGQPLSITVYVVTLYTLSMSVFMPISSSLGAIFGHKRLYLLGIGLFTLASLSASIATNLPWLLTSRVFQGIGVSTILPTIMVIIFRIFREDQRGRAVGFWALVNGAGHALGPPASGFLIQHFGWRSIFVVNLPLCLVCIFLVWKLLPNDTGQRGRMFDIPGAVSLTVAAVSLMLAISQTSRLGITAIASIMLWIMALAAGVFFYFWERHAELPFVDLALFENLRYSATIVIVSADSFSLFGLLVAAPFFLIQTLQIETQSSGLIMLSLTLTMALLGPAAGKMADRRGSRLTCVLGLCLIFAGALILLLLLITSQAGTGWLVVASCLVIIGTGLGLLQSPATAAVLQVVDSRDVGIATSLFHMTRFIMGAMGSMIFGIIIDAAGRDVSAGFQRALLAVIFTAVLGFLASFLLPGKMQKTL